MSLRNEFAEALRLTTRTTRRRAKWDLAKTARDGYAVGILGTILFILFGFSLNLSFGQVAPPYSAPAQASVFTDGAGAREQSPLLTGLISGDGSLPSEPAQVNSFSTAPTLDNPLGIPPENLELAEQYETTRLGSAKIYRPTVAPSSEPISISAQYGWKGEDDEYGEVYVLYGDCRVSQGEGAATGPIGVVWIARDVEFGENLVGARVWTYLCQTDAVPTSFNLNGACASAKTNGKAWIGEFRSLNDVDLRIAFPGEGQLHPDETYSRAYNLLRDDATPTRTNLLSSNAPNAESFTQSVASTTASATAANNGSESVPDDGVLGWTNPGTGETIAIPETSQVDDYFKQIQQPGFASRLRVQLFSRYDNDVKITHHSNASESLDVEGKDVSFISNGFTIIVQGIAPESDLPIGDVIELSADQATVWLAGVSLNDLRESKTLDDFDLELYLDGNIVFREGNRVVYADRMYYDVKNRVGVIEEAELFADVPGVKDAYFRMGATKITQSGPNAIQATDAWISTSSMGRPTYRLQSNSIVTEKRSSPLYDAATHRQLVNNETGAFLTDDKQYVVAENNYVTLGNMPVLYWPWMAMDIRDRSLYLRRMKFGHDGVLGTQILSTWNPYQLFGMTNLRPEGTDWDINLDYLSKRGFGHGTTFVYNRDTICQWDTRAVGMMNYYGIYDRGKDNLGKDRRALPLEKKYRYRGLWKHRQEIDNIDCGLNLFQNCCLRDSWTFTAQLGVSSDRNYLAQYFEDEWYSSSNPVTSLELKRTVNNRSLAVMASARTDKFYTQTSWLPRFDHFWLGQSLGKSNLAWYEHTKIGFAQFRTASSPYAADDAALFRYLDWELTPNSTTNAPLDGNASTLSKDSLVFSTRHELDLPFQLGPVKTTPYVLGEYGFWGRGVESKNVSRLYGRVGLRLNLPIWKVDSEVKSQTWYLNGLAHKMNLTVDGSYSDANKNYNKLVLFDQVDDWQVEDFRRRYSVTTFAGKGAGYSDAIPVRFDERYYAIRQGEFGGLVTSPSSELVDDLQLVRLGWNNRWQTKRGPVGTERVVDWITFNVGMNLYPKKSDNFGKVPGMLDYDASWQLGDRFAILSSGLYDFWGSGQKITRLGVQRRRPGLSSCYLGVDRLNGPIDSTYLNLDITYRTSERWGLGFSNSYDLSEGFNIGQKLTISRIGESFVFTLGASRNESKDNWGVSLSVEPVFMFDKDKREEGLLGLGNM